MRYAIFVVMLAGLTAFAQQQSSQSSSQDTSQTNAQQKDGKPSPSAANPFPEAQSRKAEDAANGATPAKQPDYSSSRVDLKRFDENASRDARISNGAGGYIHDPKLAAQDDKVGKFYLQTGDYKGAYDRYKEATLVAPEDANAVFGLAEAAKELGLKEQAIANYRIYLDALPDGKKSKDARKALAALGSTYEK
jgi:tetratricopeptide (TPR) repeat protein